MRTSNLFCSETILAPVAVILLSQTASNRCNQWLNHRAPRLAIFHRRAGYTRTFQCFFGVTGQDAWVGDRRHGLLGAGKQRRTFGSSVRASRSRRDMESAIDVPFDVAVTTDQVLSRRELAKHNVLFWNTKLHL